MGADVLDGLDAVAVAALIAGGEASPTEVVEASLADIERRDPSLGAFVHLDPEQALARAASVTDEPLAGVPFAIKDVAGYPGMPCAMGSRLLADHRPDAHSAYTQAADDAGLITLGKTATSELGLLGSTETLLAGPTRNPWGTDLSAAGSSGGAAAAVAAGLVPVAHASDGGGSIRVPASVCGVFGFKPSNGRTHAAQADASGFAALVVEHVISRTVRDSALLLRLTQRTGPDAPFPPIEEPGAGPAGPLTVAVWDTTLLGASPAPEVRAAMAEAVGLLDELGHRVRPVAPPRLDGPALSRAFFTLAGGMVDQLATMVVPMLGRDVGPEELEPFTLELLAWYRDLPPDAADEATTVLDAAAAAYLSLFTDIDVALTPTLAAPPWPLGRLAPTRRRAELVAETGELVGYTPIHNIAGNPAMSVPLHWTAQGQPVGVHAAAAPGQDRLLLELALQLEQACPWAARRPAAAGAGRRAVR